MLKNIGSCEGAPDFQRQVDHKFLFGNDFCSWCEATQVVARVAIVAFDGDSPRFSDDVTVCG